MTAALDRPATGSYRYPSTPAASAPQRGLIPPAICGVKSDTRQFALNQVWLEIALLADDLIVWTQALLLSGDLATAEPKRLRYRLLHVAARLAFHGRRGTLRLPHEWPWANKLATAFAQLKTLPAAPG